MHKVKYLTISMTLVIILFMGKSSWDVSAHPFMLGLAPPLGTMASFAVLGGSTITNIGPTVVNGDLGLSPGNSVTGFPPGSVTGASHVADALAGQAKTDATTAYNNLASQTCDFGPFGAPTNLAGQTLVPGVYCYLSTVEISTGGILTLDAQGNPNSVWIFKTGSTLTTISGASVIFINSGVGVPGCNVFWQVGSSATLGTNTEFVGNIIADASITVETGVTLYGRAIARTGAVTLDSSPVTVPVCATAATATATATLTATATVTSTATATLTATATATLTATATVTSTATATLTATATATLTATATITATPTITVTTTPTNTVTTTPTNTATNTPIVPTNTPVPVTTTPISGTPTAVSSTNTPIIGTATNTPILTTNTPIAGTPTTTSMPSTNTPMPQKNTPSSQNNTPSSQNNTPVPQNNTPVSQVNTSITAITTPVLPVVSLPETGNVFTQNEGFSWSLVIIGGFSTLALLLALRVYRSR